MEGVSLNFEFKIYLDSEYHCCNNFIIEIDHALRSNFKLKLAYMQ